METKNDLQNKKAEIKGIAILLLCSLIWGCAFSAQTVGAAYVPPFTFLAIRTWIGLTVLLTLRTFVFRPMTIRKTAEAEGMKPLHLVGGCFACGFFLFAASACQQIGIAYTTTAKAGFITALYVVFVPVIYGILRRGLKLQLWISVLLAVTGLYLLCMTERLALAKGDLTVLMCALLFSIQILLVNRFAPKIDSITLTALQFLMEGILATLCAFLLEHPTMEGIRMAKWAILYAGVMSSGFGYLLQVIGQKRVNPAAASLVMSMESVFSALGGWVILHQALTVRELFGCAVMFSAIILAELPLGKRKTVREEGPAL